MNYHCNNYRRKTKNEKELLKCLLFCRYLSIKWGIDLSKMVVFVGEKGDTDHEDLLVGLHKTIVLKGSVEHGSEDSFNRECTVTFSRDSPNISILEDTYGVHDLSAALNVAEIKSY